MADILQIRPACAEDLDAVYKLICELESQQLDFEKFRSVYLENILNPMFAYFLGVTEGNIVGIISLQTQKLLHHGGIVGEIQEFFIDKNFRNSGIGRKMISKIEEFCIDNNITDIEVTSNRRRVENVMIYEKFGYNLTHNNFTKRL